jgi:hypothetical protein
MFRFRSAARPGRVAAPRRTRLAAELLEFRDGPAGLTADTTPLGLGGGSAYPTAGFGDGPAAFAPPPPAPAPDPNVAPQIVDFAAAEVSPGVFVFTGRVIDESPAGLTVTFGGVPSARGKTTTTRADGTFSLTITLRTDGTDAGTVTAKTRDMLGLESNTATVDVAPTPPPGP